MIILYGQKTMVDNLMYMYSLSIKRLICLEFTSKLKLNSQKSTLLELPLFQLTDFFYRDAFLSKSMIGGYTNNGKGDTYF